MPVEVASYLFLVGLFGLKATPAYILAACNHRNFRSDNRKLFRTIKTPKPLSKGLWCFNYIAKENGLTKDCKAIRKFGTELTRGLVRG